MSTSPDLADLARRIIEDSALPEGAARLVGNPGVVLARAVLAREDPGTVPEGVAGLLDLLDLARDKVLQGEWDGLAIAASCPDGGVASSWHVAATGCGPLLIGAVGYLQFRLNLEHTQAFVAEREKKHD